MLLPDTFIRPVIKKDKKTAAVAVKLVVKFLLIEMYQNTCQERKNQFIPVKVQMNNICT